MNSIGEAELRELIVALSGRVAAARDLLNRLDAALGDGDHGTSVSVAFAVAVEDIRTLDEPSLSAIWLTTAKALMNRMGGASGAIFGTFFLRGVTLLHDRDRLGKAEMQALLQAGLDGVKARGKAKLGDKTMVDALEPAVVAFAEADDYDSAWRSAAAAARAGTEATKGLVARQGRARFLGQRAVGHIDPGAMTAALMFEAIDDYWRANCR
ncbi:MAG: dihydroxyacetone kinase subunit DhaL [Chloroflexi bacterium]|nr:dihydroxyacetone kinase subunit DhaL [Chloroflexota bacterium]